MRRFRILPAVAAVLVMCLSGCVAPAVTTSPTTTPATAAASPSPSPTPTAEVPELAKLIFSADTIIGIDTGGGTVASLTYFDPAADVVEELTALFGFEPTVTVEGPFATDARFSGTTYSWDGFTLYWNGFVDDPDFPGLGYYPTSPALHTVIVEPDVRGVLLEGPDGIVVRNSFEPLATAFPDYYYEYVDPAGTNVRSVLVGTVPLPTETEGNDGSWMFGVRIISEGVEGVVTQIVGPIPVNFGM